MSQKWLKMMAVDLRPKRGRKKAGRGYWPRGKNAVVPVNRGWLWLHRCQALCSDTTWVTSLSCQSTSVTQSYHGHKAPLLSSCSNRLCAGQAGYVPSSSFQV